MKPLTRTTKMAKAVKNKAHLFCSIAHLLKCLEGIFDE